MKICIYLSFPGNCGAAFAFYEQVLGGKIRMRSTYGESPMASSLPPDWQDKLIHVRLEIDGNVLMGSDAPPDRFAETKGVNVSIVTPDAAEAKRMFDALADQGTVHMPLQKTFWSENFGMLTDRFGVPWMVNQEPDAA